MLLQIAGPTAKLYGGTWHQPRHHRPIPIRIQMTEHRLLLPHGAMPIQNLIGHHTAFKRKNP